MHFLFNYFIRFILIAIISLFYLKYRNNQCIKNQNCKPYFISNFLSFKKDFGFYIPIVYELDDNIPNVDLSMENSQMIEDSSKYKNLPEEDLKLYKHVIDNFRKRGYDDLDLVNNDDIIMKKFTLKNTSNNALKVFPKMIFNEKYFKIYNCFCGSKIILEPMSTKDIFIYFKFRDFIEKDENKDNKKPQEDIYSLSIKVSI